MYAKFSTCMYIHAHRETHVHTMACTVPSSMHVRMYVHAIHYLVCIHIHMHIRMYVHAHTIRTVHSLPHTYYARMYKYVSLTMDSFPRSTVMMLLRAIHVLTSVEEARPRPLLDWCRLDRIANLQGRDHRGQLYLMIQDNT